MTNFNTVVLPVETFSLFEKGQVIANGFLFVGLPGKNARDPQNQLITTNEKQAFAKQTSGELVKIGQPIRTSAGGQPELNGSPIELVVDGEYSLSVADNQGVEIYFFPVILSGITPSFIFNNATIPINIGLTNIVLNQTLFATNGLFIDFYNANKPDIDYNENPLTLSTLPLENIAQNRFDFAEGNSVIDFNL